MISKLTKAVIDKHGEIKMFIDKNERICVYVKSKEAQKVFRSFSLGSCLINLLAEDKE
jgi:hypothetical protein